MLLSTSFTISSRSLGHNTGTQISCCIPTYQHQKQIARLQWQCTIGATIPPQTALQHTKKSKLKKFKCKETRQRTDCKQDEYTLLKELDRKLVFSQFWQINYQNQTSFWCWGKLQQHFFTKDTLHCSTHLIMEYYSYHAKCGSDSVFNF